MLYSRFVSNVARRMNLRDEVVQQIIAVMADEIHTACSGGDSVPIPDLGSFKYKIARMPPASQHLVPDGVTKTPILKLLKSDTLSRVHSRDPDRCNAIISLLESQYKGTRGRPKTKKR